MQAEQAVPKRVVHTFFFPKIFCRAAQNLSHFIFVQLPSLFTISMSL